MERAGIFSARSSRRRHLTYWRSAAGPLAGWLGAPGSMPNSTMDRLEGAVAGQLQCLVRWQAVSERPCKH